MSDVLQLAKSLMTGQRLGTNLIENFKGSGAVNNFEYLNSKNQGFNVSIPDSLPEIMTLLIDFQSSRSAILMILLKNN